MGIGVAGGVALAVLFALHGLRASQALRSIIGRSSSSTKPLAVSHPNDVLQARLVLQVKPRVVSKNGMAKEFLWCRIYRAHSNMQSREKEDHVSNC
jgi:hypothetical protein